jgi:hypothetical protein
LVDCRLWGRPVSRRPPAYGFVLSRIT